MKELDEIKKIFEGKTPFPSSNSWKFGTYDRVYLNTNENLKGYINDLTDKEVLTVSASGDQLIHMVGMGAKKVDTFDINRFSPLYQTLKLYAIMYLDDRQFYKFIYNLDKKCYDLFSHHLPEKERIFWDYLFDNYRPEYICQKLFYHRTLSSLENNIYFDKQTLSLIRSRLLKMSFQHYSTDLFQLPNYLKQGYDKIYLSNISQYIKDPYSFFNYLNYLRNFYLNDDGEIYYAYQYTCADYFERVIDVIRNINLNFMDGICDGAIPEIEQNTEVIRIEETGAAVLVLKRGKNNESNYD